jgi:hypothetical protein
MLDPYLYLPLALLLVAALLYYGAWRFWKGAQEDLDRHFELLENEMLKHGPFNDDPEPKEVR